MDYIGENRLEPHFWEIEVGDEWGRFIGSVDSEIYSHRLALSPPHVVYDHLKALRFRERDWVRRFGVDEKLLLGMDQPLVRLGLARWGRDNDVLKSLFETSTSDTPERLALFRNESFGWALDSQFNIEDDEIEAFYLQSTRAEKVALASNSGLPERFLINLCRTLGSDFSEHKDALMCFLQGVVSNNLIVENRFMAFNNDLDKCLWKLAVILPPEPPWGYYLAMLYRVMLSEKKEFWFDRGEGVPDRDILLSAAEKWSKAAKNEEFPRLDHSAEVAMHLARAGLKKRVLDVKQCLDSELIALRCAAYREETLTEETAKRLEDTGWIVEAREALMHRANWKTWQGRIRLQTATYRCWEANRGNNDLLFYRDQEIWDQIETLNKRDYPEWFEDEPDDDDFDLEASETHSDTEQIWNLLGLLEAKLHEIQREVVISLRVLSVLMLGVLAILIF